ncbi:G-type lectin S-receptor-like serine/threonine-protein kinase SD2-5 isoform X1 [Lolium rigidum]|uniref:G-type lectin S-receptor-like serine/threonine-protein kinase SD2-5 isoform X1 n=1 Tax=Lolium rigidum TaxID=89674 RepID=UPI001F5CC849|nr:G-type lectin S-receptor-like serine/threonine-protein kinase SD2-5 isoform X1 [Lolium rigidum]
MAVVSTYPSLHLLSLHLLLLATTNEATRFTIINRCSFTVGGGMQLDPGKKWTLDMPTGTTDGRLWGRTGCSFHGKGGQSCQTGDCGGVLACTDNGQPPISLAEFKIGQGQTDDFFDISLVNGFNVPMDFLSVPTQGGPGCSKGPRCEANITAHCPTELQAPGGCNNACIASGTSNCEPTTYSGFFEQMCPDAYNSYNGFTCPTGTNYQVIFCPPLNLTVSPAPASSQPAPIGQASMSLKSSISRNHVVVLAPVGGFVLLTLLFIITFFTCKQRARRQQDMEEEEEFRELQGTPVRFTFQQLKVATRQFTDKLGEGGFGSVFKGQFGDERIAVKRLDQAGQGKMQFLAEVQTISSIHHINLVRLIGFCAEKSHRLLVYEYMPKRSLDRWIYCRHDNNDPPLDWSTRCKIITHIAKGLSYLHEECTKRIAHLDVKPQNILLDDNFNAKLSDFGLCKLIDRDTSHVVTRMRGTPGYLAPEWLTSQITEKADVYSFGIVVMEIICERKNLDTSRSEESIHLITLVEEKVKSDQLVDLIDKSSTDMQAHKKDVIQMMKLAMWCLQTECKKRPNMSEVVGVLEGNMNADINISNNFVATSPIFFGIAGNVSYSAPPLVSDVSGPR